MSRFLVLFVNLLIILNLAQFDEAASGSRIRKGGQGKGNGTYEDSAPSISKPNIKARTIKVKPGSNKGVNEENDEGQNSGGFSMPKLLEGQLPPNPQAPNFIELAKKTEDALAAVDVRTLSETEADKKLGPKLKFGKKLGPKLKAKSSGKMSFIKGHGFELESNNEQAQSQGMHGSLFDSFGF